MPSHEVLLDAGWEAAHTAPGACATPHDLGGLTWLAARVPGTAAGVLRDAGLWSAGGAHDFDAEDWWFRVRFDAGPAQPGERSLLHLDGVATVSAAFLNGAPLTGGDSMFAAHSVDVTGDLLAANELVIRCSAIAPLLAVPRRPRARWRQQVVDGNLRWLRTMLLGRAPGFAPGPAAVGPWRPVRLERRSGTALDLLELRTALRGDDGVLTVRGRSDDLVTVQVSGPGAAAQGAGTGAWDLEFVLPGVARWWPHTHGEPILHDVRVTDRDGAVLAERRVGFRDLRAGPTADHDVERDGLALHVNDVAIFARGAVWTPIDPVGMAPTTEELRAALEQARDAGLNLVRVVGTGAYESPVFHDLCDELGMLVWQDFMFANLDYPIADEAFRAAVESEARAVIDAVAGRPSTVVLCGNSEIEQQVAMLGLDPALGRGELFGELLPALVSASGIDAVHIPSAPSGGALPFRSDAGVANYFGVGGYRRPIEDARRADVRFASECLAIANVPDDVTIAGMGIAAGGELFDDLRWKAGVMSDQGTDWDFDDVRDHYLGLLFGVDPAALRRADRARYLELSRAVSGELMAEVFGEWRRAGSPCAGGVVLWLRDLVAGAGWGLVDATGRPKAALHHLRRVLAPVAVWTTDEGLGGIAVHVANDGPAPLAARLRVALYRDGEHRIEDGVIDLTLPAHGAATHDAEAILGRFVDASYAYRFGPPAHDTVVATLEGGDGAVLSQAFRFPAGRPLERVSAADLGLAATLARDGREITISTGRVAYGVRIDAAGRLAADDCCAIEPGHPRTIALRAGPGEADVREATITALNLDGSLTTGVEDHPR